MLACVARRALLGLDGGPVADPAEHRGGPAQRDTMHDHVARRRRADEREDAFERAIGIAAQPQHPRERNLRRTRIGEMSGLRAAQRGVVAHALVEMSLRLGLVAGEVIGHPEKRLAAGNARGIADQAAQSAQRDALSAPDAGNRRCGGSTCSAATAA